MILEEIEKKELKNRIDNAIEFLETEYNTYPSGEEWRKALKNVLKGKNKIKKIINNVGYDETLTYEESRRAIAHNFNVIGNKINEIIDKLNERDEDV